MTYEPRPSRIRRLISLPRTRRRLQREIDDEIAFHLESRIQDLIARGLPADRARGEALREYGSVTDSRRELHRLEHRRLARDRWLTRVEGIRQDIGYSIRALRRQPGFSIGVIVVLALGIGANATMFGLIDRLLLRPPAHVADPGRVMSVRYLRSYRGDVNDQDVLSYPQYLDLKNTAGQFDGVIAYTQVDVAIGRGADARLLRGLRVTPGYFTTLGVRPAIGRLFLPEDAGDPVAPNVAVISYDYWQRGFNGERSALGQSLLIGAARYTVVGVAPRQFAGLDEGAVDIWIPLTSDESPARVAGWAESRNGYWLFAAVRLRPGHATQVAADAATRVLRTNMLRDGTTAASIAESQPRFFLRSVLPREARADDANAKVAVLLGAVSLLVLGIACANVAGLQLARGLRRQREIAVRVALGAGHGRLLQQLLTEGVVLSVLGGTGALAVAGSGAAIMRHVGLDRVDGDGATSSVDAHVLAYAALAALLAGLVTGLVPALQARRHDLTASLKEGSRHGRMQRSRARLALLIVQAALSVVLLAGTGLFVRSLRRVESLPIGMEPSRVLIATVNLTGLTYGAAETDALYHRLLDAAQGSPIVESAAIATSVPFYTSWGTRAVVPGRDSLPRVRDGGPYFNSVTPGYLRTMGMRLLVGRDFRAADQNPTARVMIVNESFAHLAWPTASAIGQCVRLGSDTMPCAEVIGVVANPRRQELIEDLSLQLFLPLEQGPKWVDSRTLLIRPKGGGDAKHLQEALRRDLQSAVPNLPYLRVRPMEELVSPFSRSWRMGATMFGAFGALALVLAVVGLYSTLMYDVTQRAHELGVRVALGANGSDLARLVIGAGVRIIAVGAALGLAVTLVAGRFVQPLLFQTSAREPSVLVGVLAIMLVATIAATLAPMWRAIGVDPIVAMRAD